MIKPIFASAALAASLIMPASASAQSNIDGVYRDSDGLTEITVRRCGEARCANITRIVRRKPGGFDTDRHNENPALRDRPILGLPILSGLRWDNGAWRGRVYNPEDGETYRAVVRPGRNGGLDVQGCVAVFCRTVNWPSVS